MARELDGAVILCWCWAHQRRDFIHGAAGQARLTRWCKKWIERIASIYKMNEARLAHYDPALERQTAAFAVAQAALEAEVERLFADAEQELDALQAGCARDQGVALAAQPSQRAECLRQRAPGPTEFQCQIAAMETGCQRKI
jgi:hypothetical protein